MIRICKHGNVGYLAAIFAVWWVIIRTVIIKGVITQTKCRLPIWYQPVPAYPPTRACSWIVIHWIGCYVPDAFGAITISIHGKAGTTYTCDIRLCGRVVGGIVISAATTNIV